MKASEPNTPFVLVEISMYKSVYQLLIGINVVANCMSNQLDMKL